MHVGDFRRAVVRSKLVETAIKDPADSEPRLIQYSVAAEAESRSATLLLPVHVKQVELLLRNLGVPTLLKSNVRWRESEWFKEVRKWE